MSGGSGGQMGREEACGGREAGEAREA